ncbi:MAG: RHS repeat-associated core domain-containing protein, partial [Pseudomonadota bacterium]
YQTTWNVYDDAGNRIRVKQPNGIPGSLHNNEWEETATYDFSGKVESATGVDSGTTHFLCDKSGNVRFMQDAEGSATGSTVYVCYDLTGRVLSKGILSCNIDSLSQKQADEADYLPIGVAATEKKSYQYDFYSDRSYWPKKLYGSGPNTIGRLCESQSQDDTSHGKFTELWAYTVDGHVQKHVTSDSISAAVRVVSYEYNHIGQITRTNYPQEGANATAFELHHGYDYIGQLVALGTVTGRSDIARYTYNAQGRVESETIDGTAAKPVASQLSYNSPGWLQKIEHTDYFKQTLQYETGAYTGHGGSAGYYDGRIAKISDSFLFPGAPESFTLQLSYDNLGQLLSASNSLGAKDSVGTAPKNEIGYDVNQNILSIQGGSVEKQYTYSRDNKLSNTDGGTTSTYQYDKNANIILSKYGAGSVTKQLSLTYDRLTQQTVAIEIGTTAKSTLELLYDSKGRYVRRSVSGSNSSTQSLVYGQSLSPIAENSQGNWRQLIHGPLGLVAIHEKGKLYPILKDHLGSTRLVADTATGLPLAGFDYLPFGQTFRSHGQSDFTNILFAGQPLDSKCGLYVDGVRLYDAKLGRFYSTDQKHQYPSPFVYAGNNALLLIDPDGMMSVWGEIGIGIAAAAAFVGGVALTIVTGGADIPVLAAIAGGISGGAVAGAGSAALVYQAGTGFDPNRWNSTAFGNAVALGALGGAVSGGISAGLNTAVTASVGATLRAGWEASAEELSEGAQESTVLARALSASGKSGRAVLNAYNPTNIAAKIGTSAFANSIGSGVSQITRNAINHKHWDKGLAQTMAISAGQGLATGAGGAAFGAANQRWGITPALLAFASSNKAPLYVGGILVAEFTAAAFLEESVRKDAW